jgi:glycosyltransferase involved in cell wall biosynthesis
MGERITAVLTDPVFRQALVDRGRRRRSRFTWDEVARKTLAALKRLPAPPPVQVRFQRPRIALFSPMPPAVSGLAVYDERLLAELSSMAEVTVFDPVREAPGTTLPGGVAHEPVQSLGTTYSPWAFDHLLYVLGNSHHHARSLEALLRHPGVVWLHDTRLPGAYNGLAERSPDPEQYMHDRLTELYPGRLPHLTRTQLRLQGDLSQKGLGMTGRIVGQATRLLLNSRLAARLLALDQPPGFDLPAIHVLRHAYPPVPERIGPSPWPGDGPLIVTLGVVDPVKAPTTLLAAFARLCATRPARLAFVGPCGEDLQDLIAANVDRLGLVGRVTLTDVVDPATYWAWTVAADLGVQLRTTTYGESSGGVHELVAAGVPCLTSVAACAEMPDGVVALVPPDVAAPELAESMASLLDDPSRRASMVAAGLADAEEHSFGWLARRLVDVLSDVGAA